MISFIRNSNLGEFDEECESELWNAGKCIHQRYFICMYALCEIGHSNDLVLVTLSESSIGSRAAAGISGIYSGFDWEHGQVRISTKKKIISYEKDRDKAIDPRKEVHAMVRLRYN